MFTHEAFQLAFGSTMGRDHRLVPKNNQDGVYLTQNATSTVGVIADGCGSTPHSEVGAKLGARLLCQLLLAETQYRRPIKWPRVQQHLLASLDVLARQLGGNYRQAVEDFLLFTIVGVLFHDGQVTFFALGDGVIIVNGEQHQLGPFEGNMPPYVGYGLLDSELHVDPTAMQLAAVVQLPFHQLEHFLIGSDGVLDLMRAQNVSVPGLEEPVGDISQFWLHDRYFGQNPELVSRRLKLLSRDWPKRDPQPGVLSDDTTLIVGRRQPATEE